MGAVKLDNQIDLVVNIVHWNTQEAYDRLGLEDQFTEILGVQVPMYTIPITPGRRLSLGAAVVFGMLLNTVIATLYVPNWYEWMQLLEERGKGKDKK